MRKGLMTEPGTPRETQLYYAGRTDRQMLAYFKGIFM